MPLLLRILHLEDDPLDAELIAGMLRRESFQAEITVCSSRNSFLAALWDRTFDVILADNYLPGFDGQTALMLAREASPTTPFIFVSGVLGEETALESLKNGATDYVFKHNLARLGPAVNRAVQEAEEHRVRLEAERALRESEATLRSFFETSPVLMGIIEPLEGDLRFVSLNRAVEQFFGFDHASCPGYATEMGIPPDTIQTWLWQIRQNRESGVPVHFEDTFHSSGRECYLSMTIARLPSLPDRPSRYCFVAEDTTIRRQMEQQALRSQRLESIGTLASGIAHDLNNVLAPITLALRLFRPKLVDPDDRELIDSVESSVKRGAQIIRQLLTFARGAEGERKVIAWPKLLGDLEQMLHDTFPRSIEVKFAAARELGPVVGDATQIYQVLMNLCVNARDAMPNGGQLTITVESIDLTQDLLRLLPESNSTRAVSIRVRDTGTGIPETVQGRIFDPFFTTKDVGVGTGLGLSTALNIVKNHGGFITAESAEGQGACFHVCLPVHGMTRLVVTPVRDGPVPAGAGQLILVVDDDRSIRTVTHATLTDHGYQVITSVDGREALEIFRREAERIQLVLTDLMMPTMDGATLIDRIREIHPTMRFVAVSGLLETSAPSRAGVHLLQKPFAAEALLRVVHDALVPPMVNER
jgi:PAS domain S-box-containing protein